MPEAACDPARAGSSDGWAVTHLEQATQSRAPYAQLNVDVAGRVFANLQSPEDLSHCCGVSRLWRDAATSPALWRAFLPKPCTNSWKTTNGPGFESRSANPYIQFRINEAWNSASAVSTKIAIPFRVPSHVALGMLPNGRHVLAAASSAARIVDGGAEYSAGAVHISYRLPSETHVANMVRICLREGVQHVCMQMRASVRDPPTLFLAYAYEDGIVDLHSAPLTLDSPAGIAMDDCPVSKDAKLLMRTQVSPGAGQLTAIDVSADDEGAVFVGTSTGDVVYLRPYPMDALGDRSPREVRTVARARVSAYPIFSVRARDDSGHEGNASPGCGVAGTAVGELIAFDCMTESLVQRYVGPCYCAVGSVDFAASCQLVTATYTHRLSGNGHGATAVAFDAQSGTRVSAFGQRRKGRLHQGPRYIRAAGTDGTCSGARLCLLSGGTVRVFDIRRWDSIAEAGEGDAVSMCSHLDSIAFGSRVGFNHDATMSAATILDFEAAACAYAQEVCRFPPDDITTTWPR